MDIKIPVRTKLERKHTVTANDTASKYGSGTLDVYATPAMIAFMEQTAYMSIEEFLPEGFGSVGISLNVQHTKATLPNAAVQCIAEVTKVEGKRVFFKVTAFDESGEIGSGEHVRYIINNEEFLVRLK